MVGVNVPTANDAGEGFFGGRTTPAIGVKGFREHRLGIQNVGATDGVSDPGNPSGVGANQAPPGGGLGYQLVPGKDAKVSVRKKAVHSSGPGFRREGSAPEWALHQLNAPTGKDPTYATFFSVQKAVSTVLGVHSGSLLQQPQGALVAETAIQTYVGVSYGTGINKMGNRDHFLAANIATILPHLRHGVKYVQRFLVKRGKIRNFS